MVMSTFYSVHVTMIFPKIIHKFICTYWSMLRYFGLFLGISFSLYQICEEILNHCLAPDCQMGGLGCDNMTVILVCLLNEGTYEELARKCARPVDSTFDENGSVLHEEEEKDMDLT